ncbi:DUF4340 domain-containing protein [Candidatus Merdisoma sp. HCP28S3_D10]|uniref:DUF4340 domain-containing protein n=1 Tax=unclassified Candidatus Merdisoma TaxID=3099611 RepID=UPI003F8A9E20
MTRKKRQIRLLAAIAALAVLGLAYVLVSRADWNSEEADTVMEELSILTVAPAEIREAVITNSYGTLRLSYDGETWASPDDSSMELNQDALTTLWGRLNPLSAVRDLGEAPEDLSAYSLSDPAITIAITREDGSEITVSIGGTASDGNVYVMTSEGDHIYTCDSYLATAFTCQLSDFEAAEEETEETETELVD